MEIIYPSGTREVENSDGWEKVFKFALPGQFEKTFEGVISYQKYSEPSKQRDLRDTATGGGKRQNMAHSQPKQYKWEHRVTIWPQGRYDEMEFCRTTPYKVWVEKWKKYVTVYEFLGRRYGGLWFAFDKDGALERRLARAKLKGRERAKVPPPGRAKVPPPERAKLPKLQRDNWMGDDDEEPRPLGRRRREPTGGVGVRPPSPPEGRRRGQGPSGGVRQEKPSGTDLPTLSRHFRF